MEKLERYLELVEREPFFRMDYPDIDVIRVGETYYCITTTMHFFPGAEILTSPDLVHWTHASYVYETLDHTPEQRLERGNIYGKGMWAASLRFYEGLFYVCFVANDTGKTYLYRSRTVSGPWKKSRIQGFYHDCSLLFDEDGRTYLVYGNRQIYLTELNETLSAPKEGGLHRLLLEDTGNTMLGYEGATVLKREGTYYFFFIHSKPDRWRRVEACFYTDSLTEPLQGGDVFDEDLGYRGAGIAQGCIIDTPEQEWYAMLFQDRGAAGRMPVLLPMHFEGKRPVLESPLALAERSPVALSGEKQKYRFRDSFLKKALEPQWQWNHEPQPALAKWGAETGGLRLTTGTCCEGLLQAVNTLTRRLLFPYCEVSVLLDGTKLRDGDFAGLAAFQGSYGAIALGREHGVYEIVMMDYRCQPDQGKTAGTLSTIYAGIRMEQPVVRLRAVFRFGTEKETVQFYADEIPVGQPKPLWFALDHFTGCRAALFCYATEQSGGSALFREFLMSEGEGE